MIYLLEDDPTRIIWCARNLEGEIQASQTCERVSEFTGAYDLILLDHDLGGRQMKGHEDCGLTFVKRVADRIHDESLVILHSWNAPAADRMYHFLRDEVRHKNVHLGQFGSPKFIEEVKPWRKS